MGFTTNGVNPLWSASTSPNVAGFNYSDDTQNISNAPTLLTFGHVGTLGYFFLLNIDPTNNIGVGFDGSTFPLYLKPSEFAFARCNGSNIYAQSSNTSAILVVRGVDN